jgi:AraC-like DNA-binding protein
MQDGGSMDSIVLTRQALTEYMRRYLLGEHLCDVGLPWHFEPANRLARGVRPPRGTREPHFHLACVLTDGAALWAEKRCVVLPAGTVLMIPPNVQHSHPFADSRLVTRVDAEQRATLVWIGLFPFGATAQLYRTAPHTPQVTRPCVLMDPLIVRAGEDLLQELTAKPQGYEPIVRGLLLEILGRLCRAPVVPRFDAALPWSPEAPADRRPEDAVTAAESFLRRNYQRPLTLAEVARAVFVSPSKLSHDLKRATGQSPMAYLAELRVSAAKSLLETDLPIRRVAELVGFRDSRYFSRVFRRVVGKSPDRFRAALASARKANVG